MFGQFINCSRAVMRLAIKSLVATVSFAVEPQKSMGEMQPDFLAVRGAFTASKCLLLAAKDHL